MISEDTGIPLFDPTEPLTIGIENPYIPRAGDAGDHIVALLVNYGAAQHVLYDVLEKYHPRPTLGQASFERDLRYAVKKYNTKRNAEARQELGTVRELHRRLASLRNGIVHGQVFRQMDAVPVQVDSEDYRAAWKPDYAYFMVKSGRREIRLDDVETLAEASDMSVQLLLAAYRFRAAAEKK